MDIDLLKTFLEVSHTHHFGQAAQNLFVTQSAVSARIRQLEEIVGAPLFTRTRNDIQLTPTGQRLLRHAESIVNTWNRARQEVSVEEDARSPLTIGGVPSLWDIVLQDWMHTVYRSMPNLVLSAEVHSANVLFRRVLDGTLDVAFMFDFPQMGEVLGKEIANVSLIMVSSRPGLTSKEAVRDSYVLVDWGTSFAVAHAKYFPGMPSPALRLGLGRLARGFLLECGGSAYLAEAMVSSDIEQGRLFPVEGAPVIKRAAYAVYAAETERLDTLGKVLSYF